MNELSVVYSVNNEEGRKNYRKLRYELKIRNKNNNNKEYLERICDEIIEYQRTGRYDLMFMKTKELGLKESQGIQTNGIEDCQGNMRVNQRHILKMCEIILQTSTIKLTDQRT